MATYPLLFIPTQPELKRYKGTGGGKKNYPPRDPQAHAQRILRSFDAAWEENAQAAERLVMPLPAKQGVYLQVKGAAGYALATQSLDSSNHYSLLNVRHMGDNDERTILATIFVPEKSKEKFAHKIHAYATELTDKGNPQNAPLVSGIEELHVALLDDFWTDDPVAMPCEIPQWCEIWLKGTTHPELLQRFAGQTTALHIERSTESILSFPERFVVLAKVNRESFHKLLQLSSDIAECRLAREPAEFFTDLTHREQTDWMNACMEKLSFASSPSVAVCILDTGVKNGHPLLSPVLQSEDLHTVHPDWGTHDHCGHGTGMAGIATYGDLTRVLSSGQDMYIAHCLESCKVRSPHNDLPPDLYGFVTAKAVSQAVETAPERIRNICMAVSAESPFAHRGEPTSWSAAIDRLAADTDGGKKLLILLSAGNVRDEIAWQHYPDSNMKLMAEDPAQSWNALTIGAYTDFVQPSDKMQGYTAMAPQGGLSPHSRTSVTWQSKWPNKPDVVFEGGNIAKDAVGNCCDDEKLSVLTTSSRPTTLLRYFNATSAATGEAAWFAAQLQVAYPHAWPETIRALMVHSAEWTPAQLEQFCADSGKKSEVASLLRICGYGVPSLQRALHCMNNSLVLVAEREFLPYKYVDETTNKLKDGMQMHLFALPWPKDALQALVEKNVTMRVTLSYFIEPSPGQRGWDDKYRYASHGLRFDVCGPHETPQEFERRIGKAMAEEEAEQDDTAPAYKSNFTGRWKIGSKGRNRGSVHSDFCEGTGADMASCNYIAVYPVVGWWKKRTHLKKVDSNARYSLIVSLHTEAQDVDIYTPVKVQIDTAVKTPVSIPV